MPAVLDADGYVISSKPGRDLRVVVTMPCLAEPDIRAALESLYACDLPASGVEVIVCVNHGENATPAQKECNYETLALLRGALVRQAPFPVHAVAALELPEKRAGVGTARKIAMDLAMQRLFEVGAARTGAIACLDADCAVSRNYLQRLEETFAPGTVTGASLYFEHPFEGIVDPDARRAIVEYELYLRYYVESLRRAGHPAAFHTIGSAMAVRPDLYNAQGGMNRRKAAEDFYFLQKIITRGRFIEINDLTIWPSARASDRVPFGTGRAVADRLATPQGSAMGESPKSFEELAWLFDHVDLLYENRFSILAAESNVPAIADFLASKQLRLGLEKLRRNSGSLDAFRRRFFDWFNLFRCLRYFHETRDRFYANQRLVNCCLEAFPEYGKHQDAERWLSVLRTADRGICAPHGKMPE